MRQALLSLLAGPVATFLFASGTSAFSQETSGEWQSALAAISNAERLGWTTTIERSEGRGFRSGPSRGKRIAGEPTQVSIDVGRRTVHLLLEGEKAAVTDRDGRWDTVWLKDDSYQASRFTASLARSVPLPTEETQWLLANLTQVKEDAPGQWSGQLASPAAEARLAGQRRDETATGTAKGSVRLLLREGALVSYAIRLEGMEERDGAAQPFWQETTVTLADPETIELSPPAGGPAALQRPLAPSEPRLPEKEARALLSRYGKRPIRVHDPSSFVRSGDAYWMFSTGNLVSAWTSPDLVQWEREPSVFQRMPDWVTDLVPDQRGHFWAPDILHHRGRYLLYYSVSSFGKNTSAIALASTLTLDPEDPAYGWKDEGIVIQSARSDNFNTIDPAIIATPENELWMAFGSFWSGLKLIQLDPETGQRIAPDSPVHAIASKREIEAPHLYYHDGWYHLFINWGKCCRGVESTYEIRIGRSRHITGPYLDREGNDLMEGGGTLLLDTDGPFIGPGHANVYQDSQGQWWFSCHYYDALERGRSMLAIQRLTWSRDGWPELSSP